MSVIKLNYNPRLYYNFVTFHNQKAIHNTAEFPEIGIVQDVDGAQRPRDGPPMQPANSIGCVIGHV